MIVYEVWRRWKNLEQDKQKFKFLTQFIAVHFIFEILNFIRMSLHPTVRWAQRKQKFFITLGLRDIINERVYLKDNTLDFECESHGKKYEFCVEFYEEIEQEKSQWNKTGFEMVIVLAKKDTKKAYWPRLTKQNKKTQYLQCDWDKWIDEDEEEEDGQKGLTGFDENNMNSFNDSDDQEELNEGGKIGGLDDLEVEEQDIESVKKGTQKAVVSN